MIKSKLRLLIQLHKYKAMSLLLISIYIIIIYIYIACHYFKWQISFKVKAELSDKVIAGKHLKENLVAFTRKILIINRLRYQDVVEL